MAYSEDRIQRDRAALLRTGRFLDVRAVPQRVGDEVNVVFTLTEKPTIEAIRFQGAEEVKPKQLLKELPFGLGDPLDLYQVRQGVEMIERLYHEDGYAFVQVSYNELLLQEENIVEYVIVENQRVRVRDIEFENNVTYSDHELKGQIETKEYIPVFRTGDFDAERAARDAATVQKYYRDRGFLDAEVSHVIEYEDVAREKLAVTFRVNEGRRYHIGEIILEGNTILSDEALLDVMASHVGEPMLAARLQQDLKDIATEYGSRGYIDAIANSSWVYSNEPDQVVLTITIREGEQFRVGWIEVRGNINTQEKCVRREVRLYPQEIYDITEMRGSERRLKGTGLFSEATVEAISPEKPEPNVRDLLVTVEENPQTNQFIAGIGASSDSGLVGNFVLENTNFDLFDTPRSWGELFRGRAFRGAGQTLRLQLEPGTEVTRFRIDFREPYLMDKPIGYGQSLYLFARGRDGYTEERAGATFSLDKRFEEGLLEGWVGEVALRTDYVTVDNRDAWAAEDIRDVDGSSYLSTVKLSLLHDTTDSRFDPSRGHRLRLSWEQAGALGGHYYHSKLSGSYVRNWTVAVDEKDRKSVVTAHARVGQILGDAPVFERFYAGGIGSVRGFAFRGISPRDGLRGNKVGGDFMLLGGAEYSFPLYARVIRGVFFSDMGTVEESFGLSSWRVSAGVGVRLTLDFFGTIPMEFDLAFPVAKDGDDNTRAFSFFIGLPFL
jgi:outer membrane protein assembly complex protein YaeT